MNVNSFSQFIPASLVQCCLDASLPLKSSHGLFGFVAWPAEQMIPRVQRWARLRHRLLLCEKLWSPCFVTPTDWNAIVMEIPVVFRRASQEQLSACLILPSAFLSSLPRLHLVFSALLHHPPSNPSYFLRPSKSWREAKSLDWAGNPQGGPSVTPPWKVGLCLQLCFCDIAASSWLGGALPQGFIVSPGLREAGKQKCMKNAKQVLICLVHTVTMFGALAGSCFYNLRLCFSPIWGFFGGGFVIKAKTLWKFSLLILANKSTKL